MKFLLSLTQSSLKQRFLTIISAIALVAFGIHAYLSLPIDAFPDVAPPQVLISAKAPGLSPEELESQVTVPLEINMRGIANLVKIRSTTRYSTALVTLEFTPSTDIFWARAQVNERLSQLTSSLPPGIQTGLAPVITALGEMYMFTLDGPNLTAIEARTILDWTIRPALRSVPGVADVNTLGGFVRTYQVIPSPLAMSSRGISVDQLKIALQENNRNDGAGRIVDGEESLLVQAQGRVQSIDDVRNIVVQSTRDRIVRVQDIADVRFGELPRNGIVTKNGEGEAVFGLVLGLRGANARTVVDGVKEKLVEIKSLLPPGVEIVPFYDRSELIGKAVWTVQKVLLEAIVLVIILLLLFLGNFRAALVVSIMLPIAVLATFGIMYQYGLSANIMSLGGLAIAIGLLVDCGVVVVENVAHRINHEEKEITLRMKIRMTLEATKEVSVPLIAGVAVIIVVFTPLLALEGLEGRLFGPVALTIIFALVSALILALTVVPVLSSILLKKGSTRDPWLVRKLTSIYVPSLEWSIKNPIKIFITAGIFMVLAIMSYQRIGSTFMPVMDEGTPVVTIRSHPTTSLDQVADLSTRIQQMIKERVPEVKSIISRSGADELGIDPVGLNETDMFFGLRDKKEWRKNDVSFVLGEIRKVLDDVPGINYAFTQPIDMRVQEMIIGARGDVVVKIFGQDISELNKIASEVSSIIEKIEGSRDVFALRNEGMKYLRINLDRFALGRLGLNAQTVQNTIRVWIDGENVGFVLEGERRIALQLRGDEVSRRSERDISRIPIVLPQGGTVLLSQIAKIEQIEGPVQIIREDVKRFSTVLANVSGRDLVGFVDEAKAKIAENITLPKGYEMVFGGQFENQQRASKRLAIVVPIALSVIFLILYMTFGSIRQAVLVFCNVPFAAIGGILALYLSGNFLSVPASVGFIALIGIAVLNGVVLLSYINKLITEGGIEPNEAVITGAKRRMTPVVLTASIAAFGLIPFLFATGPGSEIQRPLAIVVIGGLITATILTLILLPILVQKFGFAKIKEEDQV